MSLLLLYPGPFDTGSGPWKLPSSRGSTQPETPTHFAFCYAHALSVSWQWQWQHNTERRNGCGGRINELKLKSPLVESPWTRKLVITVIESVVVVVVAAGKAPFLESSETGSVNCQTSVTVRYHCQIRVKARIKRQRNRQLMCRCLVSACFRS